MSINHRRGPSSSKDYEPTVQKATGSSKNYDPTVQRATEHPERMDIGSQRFFGEPRPGDPTHKIDDYPYELIPDVIRNNPNRAKKIAAGVFAGLTVLGIGGYFGLKSVANDTIERFESPLPANSAPEVPGQDNQIIPTENIPVPPIETSIVPESNEVYTYTAEEIGEMAPTAFAQLDTTTLLDYSVDRLLETREQAYKIIQEQGTSKQAEIMSSNASKKQKILNDFSADLMSASAQGKDLEAINNGMKYTLAIMSPENPNTDNVLNRIADDDKIIEVYEENEEYQYAEIKNNTFMGKEIGSDGAEIIRVTNAETGKESVMLFEKAYTSDGVECDIYSTAYSIGENAYELEYELQRYRINQ